ncbi:MAG TPA: DUF1559 domain-containing protein, partial [Planctomycetaceae bacterium]|nr:DUF1559 domain-containing protein [Planctomycetaceae bacterium]
GFTLLEVIVVFLILLVVIALFLPNVGRVREAAPRSRCRNNLKQIGLALHNYQDTYGTFPPTYTVDADGNPLHSWRTLILPFIEEQQLYDKIDLSKPWDDLANAEVFATVPRVYRCPSSDPPPNYTTYQAVVSPNSFFRQSEPRKLSEIVDGSMETLIVIEAAPALAVHWMAPLDADEHFVLGFGPETEFPHKGGTQALFLDGSVQFLLSNTTVDERRDWIYVEEKEHQTVEEEHPAQPQ